VPDREEIVSRLFCIARLPANARLILFRFVQSMACSAAVHGLVECMIKLKYGVEFHEDELIDLIKRSGRDYIVQGQKVCTLDKHPKQKSLDVWLRHRFTRLCNIKLADNHVLDALVAMGKFEIGKDVCPDSSRECKAVRVT
jgi:hypothetical protein